VQRGYFFYEGIAKGFYRPFGQELIAKVRMSGMATIAAHNL
jgi:hypothetical protein